MFEEGRNLAHYFRKQPENNKKPVEQIKKEVEIGWVLKSEKIKTLFSNLKEITKSFDELPSDLQEEIANVEETINRGLGEEDKIVIELESILDKLAWQREKYRVDSVKSTKKRLHE